jgi:hypothetical protein
MARTLSILCAQTFEAYVLPANPIFVRGTGGLVNDDVPYTFVDGHVPKSLSKNVRKSSKWPCGLQIDVHASIRLDCLHTFIHVYSYISQYISLIPARCTVADIATNHETRCVLVHV